MPAPVVNEPPMGSTSAPQVNGTLVNGDGPKGAESSGASANDNIRRFVAPSRPMSPKAEHTLFHDKTRCFV